MAAWFYAQFSDVASSRVYSAVSENQRRLESDGRSDARGGSLETWTALARGTDHHR